MIDINQIQEKIGYYFSNTALLEQAFITSSISAATQNRVKDYQPLEFIGDSVLGLSVVKNLVAEYCTIDENEQLNSSVTERQMTEAKNSLVKNLFLAKCEKALGLEKYLQHASGFSSADKKNKKGDLIETILGAVILDSNWNMHIAASVAKKLLSCGTSQIDSFEWLKVHCTGNLLTAPSYSFWKNSDGNVDCLISISEYPELFIGSGRTETIARNNAAELAKQYICSSGQKQVTVNKVPKQSPVIELNRKFLAKEIAKPEYEFVQTKESGTTLWLCNLTILGDDKKVSAKASSKKLAKQNAALGLLNILKKNECHACQKQGLGLLKLIESRYLK